MVVICPTHRTPCARFRRTTPTVGVWLHDEGEQAGDRHSTGLCTPSGPTWSGCSSMTSPRSPRSTGPLARRLLRRSSRRHMALAVHTSSTLTTWWSSPANDFSSTGSLSWYLSTGSFIVSPTSTASRSWWTTHWPTRLTRNATGWGWTTRATSVRCCAGHLGTHSTPPNGRLRALWNLRGWRADVAAAQSNAPVRLAGRRRRLTLDLSQGLDASTNRSRLIHLQFFETTEVSS